MGTARSCYSVACRWYPGGPIGRVRYYFVPRSNRLLRGPLAVWPSTELLHEYRTEDNGEVGDIPGAPRRWERGTNFRPDLTGDHPFGSAEEFAGRAPLPAVQPPDPECTENPGVNLPLEIRGAVHQAGGDFGDVNAVIRFDEAKARPYWWIRREELQGYSPGDLVTTWASVGTNTTPAGNAASGNPLALAGPDGSIVGVVLDTQVALGTPFLIGHNTNHTLFVLARRPVDAASSGPMVGAPFNLAPFWRGIGHFPDRSEYRVPFTAGGSTVGIGEGALRLWTWRRLPNDLELYYDGVLTASGPWPTSLGGFDFNRIGGATTVVNGPAVSWIYEFVYFDQALDANQLALWTDYLLGRLRALDPDTLYLHPGDPLYLHPGDPLILR